MKIETRIIADSMAPSGVRLTTFVLTYPRFIHSEFMTHRAFSRNASSSRAIPVKKQIEMVIDNPVVPKAFNTNKPGMQGGDPLEKHKQLLAEDIWIAARWSAVEQAQQLADLGVHKQYVNRLLEPFAYITVVCTATDYANFFALRCHPDAQPEIQELANKMYDAYAASCPVDLAIGEWHLPFAGGSGWDALSTTEKIKCSVARCARVSYLNHEGKEPALSEDLKLYQRLVGATPLHASPAEHQALAIADPAVKSGNFRGWIQYRQTLANQNIFGFSRSY